MTRTEKWSRGNRGTKESMVVVIDETGNDAEPTGTVVVSIELLRSMLIEMGFFKDEY